MSIEEFIVWSSPYIKGTKPSIDEICDALIDIYHRTGRIVLDPFIDGNFIKMTEAPGKGKTVCVDVGLAVKYVNTGTRRHSVPSLNYIANISVSDYLKPFAKSFKHTAELHLIQLVKALIYMAEHYPQIKNVDFLKDNDFALVSVLAKAFDEKTLSENEIKIINSIGNRQGLFAYDLQQQASVSLCEKSNLLETKQSNNHRIEALNTEIKSVENKKSISTQCQAKFFKLKKQVTKCLVSITSCCSAPTNK